MHADAQARAALCGLAALAAFAVTPACASEGEARRKSRPAAKVQEGLASYYGKGFAGKKTASGERFDPEKMTAAHPRLPLGTKVRVTRKTNGASVIVKVNDRCGCTHGRIIDLSEGAARKLGMIRDGVAQVRLEVVDS